MHKPFYASGLLYHLKTQQIALRQPNKKNNTAFLWSMLGGPSRKEEIPEKAFQRIMHKILKVKFAKKHIHPIYDYFHNTLQTTHYVFYVEVSKIHNFNSLKGDTLSWVTFKQTLKLPLSQQTKQDIVVSERVIKAQARSKEAIKVSPSK